MEIVKRGYREKDEIEFGCGWREKMGSAAQEVFYLLNRGYEIKAVSSFVGNHYLLSERQRLALVRMIGAEEKIKLRQQKEAAQEDGVETVHIDGFNTIITLEVALSGSLLIQGMDGTIRDLAGLRGTYRIVDKTVAAVELMLKNLQELQAGKAVIYLDQPVSNSGRLKGLIEHMAENYMGEIQVQVIHDVDRQLYGKKGVITSDAIILDHCESWYNLNRRIIEKDIPEAWVYQLDYFF